jgi:o-succinylbenzoate synthase
MKMWIAPYELQPRGSLNNRSTGAVRSGALLRVETERGDGFADIHPWPELGDDTLSEQLDSIIEGRPTRLAERSLWFAQKDALYRSRGESAFREHKIPDSHFFIPDIFVTGVDRLHAVVQDGFRTVKIKVGRNVSAELQQFQHIAAMWPNDLKIRLDFNSILSPEAADDYLDRLPSEIKKKIEFIEDPTRFSVETWAGLYSRRGMPLALDLEADNEVRIQRALEGESIQYIVIKPAVQNAERITDLVNSVSANKESARVVRFSVTTYLDHPLGQVGAAWVAASINTKHPERMATCGLLSHLSAYEPNEFSELLENRGPKLIAPEGRGFGFNDLLQRQNWTSL